jgi:hypothetical protein
MPAPPAPSPAARRWRLAGWLLLALGWGAALAVYATASGTAHLAAGYSLAGGQAFADAGGPTGWQAQQILRTGGQGTLMLVRLDQWLASLWHGRRLAATLAVGALVLALTCRWVAGLVDEGG